MHFSLQILTLFIAVSFKSSLAVLKTGNFPKWALREGVFITCVDKGNIALTFDDGPAAVATENVLDVLKEKGVRATFFVNGKHQDELSEEKYESILKRIHNEGHEIGSHTWSHKYLTRLNIEEIREEMVLLENKVKDILGIKMKIMRPPYGDANDRVIDILHKEMNYSVIFWNFSTEDWRHPNDTRKSMNEYKRILDPDLISKFSCISLHHDPLPTSAELASQAIDFIQKTGFKLVTVSQCIGHDRQI